MADDDRSVNSLYFGPGNRDSNFAKKPTFSFNPVGVTLQPLEIAPPSLTVTAAPNHDINATMPWLLTDYG